MENQKPQSWFELTSALLDTLARPLPNPFRYLTNTIHSDPFVVFKASRPSPPPIAFYRCVSAGGCSRVRSPDDPLDPPPPFFRQSWRGCGADVSEGERVFVFWSPEETTHITVSHKLRAVISSRDARFLEHVKKSCVAVPTTNQKNVIFKIFLNTKSSLMIRSGMRFVFGS